MPDAHEASQVTPFLHHHWRIDMNSSATITVATEAISAGRMVLVVDDENRENEGDLIMAGEHISTEDVVFMLRYGSGIICTPMTGAIADDLDLPPMVPVNTDNHGTAFTVTVDAMSVGTGISAEDRALTIRALASSSTRAQSLRRPGHVFHYAHARVGYSSATGTQRPRSTLCDCLGVVKLL